MFRMDAAWHFKHGAVHWVYLVSLLATTDLKKTSVSEVMACDTAGDNLFPFFLSNVYWSSALLVDMCSYAYMGVYAPIVSLVQCPVFAVFVEWIGSSHQAQISEEEKDRAEHLCFIIFLSLFAASGGWVMWPQAGTRFVLN